MTYIVQPSVELTDITQTDNFFELLAAYEQMEESPACEFFGFGGNKGAGFDPKKIDLRDISNQSIQMIAKCVENLNRCVDDWEHRLSKEMNACVSKMFGANQERVKMLNADLKAFSNELQKIDKMLKERGLTTDVKDQLGNQKEEILDRIENVRAMVRELKASIMLTPEMYNAVDESIRLSSEGLNLVLSAYGSYEKTVSARTKTDDFRFGTLKAEDYLRELIMHRTNLSDPNSSISQRLLEITRRATEINESRIYNVDMTIDPGNAVEFSMQRTNDIVVRYKGYRKVMANMHKRLNVLRKECRDIAAGKETLDEPSMIAQEVVFLTIFCMKYSEMMLLFLRPQFGIIEAVTKA